MNLDITVRVIDTGATMLTMEQRNPLYNSGFLSSQAHILDPLFDNPNQIIGIFFVADCYQKTSLQDCKRYNEYLKKFQLTANTSFCKYLMVNKSDLLSSKRTVESSRTFNAFLKEAEIIKWAYTVSHPCLGDIDSSRPCASYRQQSLESLCNLMIMRIIQQRHRQAHTLVLVPFSWNIQSQESFESDEVTVLFNSK
jgi:hypothetical protein